MNDLHGMRDLLLDLGRDARSACQHALHCLSVEERSAVHQHGGSDLIYRIDQEVETRLVHLLDQRAEALGGIVMVAEGIGEDECSVYPRDLPPEQAVWRLLVDPIDGTRGLMVDKRSAWFLAGAAPNRGSATRLSDIVVSAMVELPTTRARVGDVLWTCGSGPVEGLTEDLQSGCAQPFQARPSRATTWRGGFGQFARFFPPGREILSRIEDRLLERLYPDARPGEILSFEDQYISSGGQLYELITGKDRFTADLRGRLFASAAFAERRIGHVCHPYDLAALTMAVNAGILVTDDQGRPLDAPFDTRTPVNWIAYANPAIRAEIEPALLELLAELL